ncbi:SUMO protease [Phytophthora megakarya]|uniref:SUMO protease n=1 Tax=Phytophthora megakarya TaxID=4795 RepID=A0A225VB06_9STRA|nr:SUMO protease [Phytophthora megakarya]
MNEISVIIDVFPNATVLLAIFHLLKYLRTVIRETRFGRYAGSEYHSMRYLFANLVDASTEMEYQQNMSVLKKFACGHDNKLIMELLSQQLGRFEGDTALSKQY